MRTIMIKITGRIFFLVMILGALVGYGAASNHNGELGRLSPLDAGISELNQTLKDRQSEKIELLKESDKLAEKIIKEKRKSQSRSSRKLDSMLRESQHLVSSLESISRQIAEIEGQLKQKYSAAITALVNRLERESKEKKKKILVKQLLKYIEASEGLEEPIQLQMSEVNLEIQESDTPFEIQKKADFLSDRTTLLKARMFQIDSQIAKLEKEKVLRDKVKKFADEISFFDHTLFVEERKIAQKEAADTQDDKTGTSNEEEGWLSVDTDAPPVNEGIRPGETSFSFTVQRETSDSSPSDLILSSGGIDNQIKLLNQQKLRLGEQVRTLWQKMQSFYKRVEELKSLKYR